MPNTLENTPSLLVGIGASAGGVEALISFFEQVPPQSGIAYIVILHLSPDYDSQLTQILQNVTPISVCQVTQKQRVVADQIYVIAPNQHLEMQDGHIAVLPNMTVEDRRAPVDILFRTLAESHGSRATAVILSGTGANGSMGLKRIKEKGGAVFVQNPYEAAFTEMPRNAIATELVDDVLPVAHIPARLITYHQNLGTVVISQEVQLRPEDQQQALREVFTQLRLRTGHDFSNYKRPTLLRRLERRINVRNLPNLSAYAAYLYEHPQETTALLKDLLISVTNFFRDKAVFTALEQEVLPRLIQEKKAGDTLRIWVAGCATGEEAYSLAMLCAEATSVVIDAPSVQIFATDLDEAAIATAREGLYTLNDAADVPPERLRRFFTAEGDSFRISREIRELVLFAHHNVLKDPPFSRLDLISCRNLLIYLNQTAQERVLETFHFALNPGAYLVLGQSETVETTKDLYANVHREYHMYQSRPVRGRRYLVPEHVPRLVPEKKTPLIPQGNESTGQRLNFGDLHLALLEQYAPPSIIVNDEYDILHITERAGRYLHFAGGEVSKNLLRLIRPELRLELRTAFYQASQQQTNVEARHLKLQLEERIETLTLHVRPVLGTVNPARGYFLVLFEPVSEESNPPRPVVASVEPIARQLEEELIRVKAQLRASNEHYELQAEALKASNEELQAMNEELRSAAEELETSKEELQSINEELTTVNQELKVKVEEVSLSSNNLRNLINSTHIATLFLDRSLRVNLFTSTTREIFNLIPTDFGRPLTDITHQLDYDQLSIDAEKVLTTLQTVEQEVSTTNGRTFIMRILPYRTAEDRINGVVITFVDISRRKAAEEALRASEERFRLFILASSDSLFKMNADWTEMSHLQGNDFLVDPNQPGLPWLDQYIPSEDRPQVKATIQQSIENKETFELKHRVIRQDGTVGWAFLRAIPILNAAGAITEWFGAASDITHRPPTD
ncbi:CheR family methyltransferase [Larkinella rosea]|uniref:PAS domain S-box protein n=1 Tax=Larkinella rosea TaxID=2025312 RepID=A0A3P1C455_9BACT|nr:CheR family methyltransferase [Larkinella rosea]RRB07846.1 PAS domain S-box protein [Larkinella rosea]